MSGLQVAEKPSYKPDVKADGCVNFLGLGHLGPKSKSTDESSLTGGLQRGLLETSQD